MKSLRQIGFTLALIFTILGAINWGSIGFFGFNFIDWGFKCLESSPKITYNIIGIAGVFLFININKIFRRI